jgi:glycosyltransferase involved in cell wall biosynthesis
MKIAIVCDVLGEENNGTTVAAMNLIRHLKAQGHEVRVVCPDEYRRGQEGYYVFPQLNVGPLNQYVRKVGVSIAVSDDTVLGEALEGVDIVHIMTPFFLGKAALDWAKAHGIPVTAGFHAQAENITSHLHLMNSRLVNDLTYKVMYRLVYQYVDAIHYPTRFIRDVFEAEVGPTNGYVISNGVNSRFVKAPAHRPEDWEGRFVILFTGRYGKEKSHKVLIDAVAKSKYADTIQLVFAGEGPLHEELAAYGSKLPNPPVMRFFSRDEMLNVINSADLYVHSAEIEIEAIACLEAISCGLVPVIADSPRSAARFFALSENNLFHFNDPLSLRDRIEYWMEHPEEKAACSREYQGYTRRFEQKSCMEQMEQMLHEVCTGKHKRTDL